MAFSLLTIGLNSFGPFSLKPTSFIVLSDYRWLDILGITQDSHPIVNTTSTVASSALRILSSGSHNVALADLLGQNTCTTVGQTSLPAPSNLVPLMTLTSPAADVVDNLALTTHANVDHTTPQVTSPTQATSPPLALPSITMYTFQTCMAHQQDADPAWDAFAGSQCLWQSPTSPVAVHEFCAQQHLASLAATSSLILEGST